MPQIERNRWRSFADRFTRTHEGWGATLETRRASEPMRVVVSDYPFEGITVEERAARERLILTFGDDKDEHFTTIIEAPQQLSAGNGGDLSDATVVVRDAGGDTYVLLLQDPLREM